MQVVPFPKAPVVRVLAVTDSERLGDSTGLPEETFIGIRDVDVIVGRPAFRKVGAQEPADRCVQRNSLRNLGSAVVLDGVHEPIVNPELGAARKVSRECIDADRNDEAPAVSSAPPRAQGSRLCQLGPMPISIFREEFLEVELLSLRGHRPPPQDRDAVAEAQFLAEDWFDVTVAAGDERMGCGPGDGSASAGAGPPAGGSTEE